MKCTSRGVFLFARLITRRRGTWGGNAGPANRGWVVSLGEGGEPALGEKWWRWRRTTMETAAAAAAAVEEDSVGRWVVVTCGDGPDVTNVMRM